LSLLCAGCGEGPERLGGADEDFCAAAPQNAWRISRSDNPDAEAGLGKRLQLVWRRIIPKSIL
jgi:hypothetical protein